VSHQSGHFSTSRKLKTSRIAGPSWLVQILNSSFCLLFQLAQAVELLFDRLDSMNVACVDRFATWFAYHLSNFQFRWTWEDWSQCLAMDPLQPKPKFVRETLSKCMRLSYHQRVIELAPDTFSPLMPEMPNPFNKYTTEDGELSPEFTIVTELMEAFKSKAGPDSVLDVLDKLETVVGTDNG
jgi:nuclear cap-binding protein subunit 1